MLLRPTSAPMRWMSAGPSRRWPRTLAETGWQTPCERGVTKAAIEVSGEASHSPHPTWPPAATRTSRASWLPSASRVTSGIEA